MSFRLRFALLFSLSVFIILAIVSIYIVVLNEDFRRKEFFHRLETEAHRASDLYFSSATSAEARLQLKYQFSTLPEEELIVLDTSLNVLYANPSTPSIPVDNAVFSKAKMEGILTAINKQRETGIIYRDAPVGHYIYIAAYDKYGRSKANNLLVTLIVSVIGGLILSALLAFLYVNQVLKPLKKLKLRMQQINEQNLTERLEVTGSGDEVDKIAQNFNDMLNRLEDAFEVRKSFVQHASHELRTPLANMLSQTEVALNQDYTKEQYRNVLLSLKEEQQDMIGLTNSLLLLSQYESLPHLSDWKPIRIDELVYETIDITKNVYRNAVISVDFEELPEDDALLQFRGSDLLIKSAFQNLIRNACMYSEDNIVTITIHALPEAVVLYFRNKGRQLTEEEQQRLFIPFFRGDNSISAKGFGLGLSIVQRILALHKGSVSYQALHDQVNQFTVRLPHA